VAAEALVAMVDRFHHLREFAGRPVDTVALDTLTTMVHRGLFGGSGPEPVKAARARKPAAKTAR
jgi:hypothetical protein